jgi:hypothetical protein
MVAAVVVVVVCLFVVTVVVVCRRGGGGSVRASGARQKESEKKTVVARHSSAHTPSPVISFLHIAMIKGELGTDEVHEEVGEVVGAGTLRGYVCGRERESVCVRVCMCVCDSDTVSHSVHHQQTAVSHPWYHLLPCVGSAACTGCARCSLHSLQLLDCLASAQYSSICLHSLLLDCLASAQYSRIFSDASSSPKCRYGYANFATLFSDPGLIMEE